MDLLDTILALYGHPAEQPPVGVVCFDRELAIVYPPSPLVALPTEALAELARRVVATGVAESDVALAGCPLVASAQPLVVDARVAGVVCVLENPSLAAGARQQVAFAATPIAVFDERGALQFGNVAWNALVPEDALSPEASGLLERALASHDEVAFTNVRFGQQQRAGTARRFVNALGTFTGVVVTVEAAADHVTLERARERAALAESELANRQKDQFIATVSHELRAPLAAMLLWEKVLRDESLDTATRVKALDAIHESAKSQSQLVADLLDVSRAINGKLHIDRSPVAIDELIVAVIDATRPIADQRQVRIAAELGETPHHVLGDANRLRQIFANVLTNAIKCTGAGGLVTVRALQRDANVEISVEDTGRGIPPDLLPHLFEPFRQGSGGSDGGLGLGLAVANQLVALHGGTITASSGGVGQGATFRVTLPLSASHGTQAVTAAGQRLGGVHVLVVDDDDRVLEALQLLLERAGAIVETARSGDAGFGAVERAVPDVVLSDLAMPDGDGCSMIRRIRAQEAGVRHVPAVAMTAHVAEINRQGALQAGFDGYLTKPLDIDHLISTIARLVPVR